MKLFESKNLSRSFSVLILAVILVVAYMKADSIGQVVQDADALWLGTGLICYCLNYIFRSYRLWILSAKSQVLFPNYVKLAMLHGFNSYFLPIRSGDLTLPFLLKAYASVPVVTGGRILIKARLLDMYSLGFLLFGSTLFTPTALSFEWKIVFAIVAALLIASPYCVQFFFQRNVLWMQSCLERIFGKDLPFCFPTANETFFSLLIWFWTGCTFYCVIRSLKISLSFFDVWFFTAVQLPLQLLPVQGIANSGNHEVGWVVALEILGQGGEGTGLSLALSSHVVFISYVLILGAFGILMPSGNSPKVNAKN